MSRSSSGKHALICNLRLDLTKPPETTGRGPGYSQRAKRQLLQNKLRPACPELCFGDIIGRESRPWQGHEPQTRVNPDTINYFVVSGYQMLDEIVLSCYNCWVIMLLMTETTVYKLLLFSVQLTLFNALKNCFSRLQVYQHRFTSVTDGFIKDISASLQRY